MKKKSREEGKSGEERGGGPFTVLSFKYELHYKERLYI